MSCLRDEDRFPHKKFHAYLPNIGDLSYPGDYDSTEIHNYPFVEEGGRDRGATNYDCTEIHNYPLDEAGGRGHH